MWFKNWMKFPIHLVHHLTLFLVSVSHDMVLDWRNLFSVALVWCLQELLPIFKIIVEMISEDFKE